MSQISTARLEAFSDGVIAILITVMVFDLKLQEIPTGNNVWSEMTKLLPKFISYTVSFLTLAIMWVNHHQLFHQIKQVDRRLLWYNIQLLFWMSFVPFGTNFIGANHLLWQASFFYGIIFFMNALSFTFLRNYVNKNDLLHDIQKNRLALVLYLTASLMSFITVYVSFALFLLVPAMYFIPEKITHLNQNS